MNMPRFTADVSLYRTGRHYQTSRQVSNVPAQMIGTIRLSMEVIEIHDPWPPEAPWNPPAWGGHEGTGSQGGPVDHEPADSRGGGGGGKRPPKELPVLVNGCTFQQYQSKAAKPCRDQRLKDKKGGVKEEHYLSCNGSTMECCQTKGKGRDRVTVCDEL